jgi:hypothetical protein
VQGWGLFAEQGMIQFLHIVTILFLLYNLTGFEKHKPLFVFFWPALLFKCAAGIGIYTLYRFYYQEGDVLLLLNVVQRIGQLAYIDPGAFYEVFWHHNLDVMEYYNIYAYFEEPRQFFFVQCLVPLVILIPDPWILAVYLSLFAFMGTWNLANRLVSVFGTHPLMTALAFLFFPSAVFWTSGILKEAIVIPAMFWILSYTIKWFYSQEKVVWYEVLWAIFIGFIAYRLRFHFVIPFLLALGSLVWVVVLRRYFPILAGRTYWQYLLFLIPFLSVLFLGIHLSAHYFEGNFWYTLHANYEAFLRNSGGENVYTLQGLSADPSSFIPHIPKAMGYALFGPLLFQVPMGITVLVSLENTVLLLFFLTSLVFHIQNRKAIPLEAFAILCYILFVAFIIGFSTPNWGTMIRYKTAYLSFMALLSIHFNPLNYLLTAWANRKPK